MKNPILSVLLAIIVNICVPAEEVPFSDIAVDATGRIQIQVASSPEFYYILYVCRDLQ